MDERIGVTIRVPGNEVGGTTPEPHEAAVGRDRNEWKASGIPFRPVRGHTDALGRASLTVSDKDVIDPVRVTRHKIRGSTCECNEPTVRRDRRLGAVAVSLHAA